MKRYALISLHGTGRSTIDSYLPQNYQVCGFAPHDSKSSDKILNLGPCVVIEGRDNAGWTLDDYVLPRLASGLIWGHEIDLSHPVMKALIEEKS